MTKLTKLNVSHSNTRKRYGPQVVEGYVCQYCQKNIKRETSFIAHKCREQTRFEFVNTAHGQIAYRAYIYWLKKKKSSGNIPVSTFITSRSFVQFKKFAEELVVKAGVKYWEKYIDIMMVADLDPTLWRTPGAFQLYSSLIDTIESPKEILEQNMKWIVRETELRSFETIPEFIMSLSTNELIEHVKRRNLSGWTILHSKSFKQLIHSKDDADKQIILTTILRPSVWNKKLAEKPDYVSYFSTEIDAMGF